MHEAHFTEALCAEYYGSDEGNLPETSYPLSYLLLGQEQSKDKDVLKELKKTKSRYALKAFTAGGKTRDLICHNDKIVVPKSLQSRIVQWYHDYLGHPGINRTEETICQHLWWPKMRNQITNSVSSCLTCQRNKRRNRKFGHLPEKEAEAQPWDKMCINLIGPYAICRKSQDNLICKCVTMIDPATGWFEIHQYDDKRAITVANIAEEEWFCRYPWPTQVTSDHGSEFIGYDFRQC